MICSPHALVQILALDEPTLRLDPASRRDVWRILKKHGRTRATLLVTRRMEEAQRLADRVAVIVSGRLQCYCSPRFLQKSLGKRNTHCVVWLTR